MVGQRYRVDESSTRTGCVATEGPRLDYTCLDEVDFSELRRYRFFTEQPPPAPLTPVSLRSLPTGRYLGAHQFKTCYAIVSSMPRASSPRTALRYCRSARRQRLGSPMGAGKAGGRGRPAAVALTSAITCSHLGRRRASTQSLAQRTTLWAQDERCARPPRVFPLGERCVPR